MTTISDTQLFETILYRTKKAGENVNRNQVPTLRRMWPSVLGEVRERAVKESRLWYRIKAWWAEKWAGAWHA